MHCPTITPMSNDLMTTIRRDMDARLRELRPLVREAEALQRALDALEASASTTTGNGRTRPARARARSPRAPRGDAGNRVVAYVEAHPGSTAGDVAKALRMNRNSVATRLAQLVKSGRLVKAEPKGYAGKP